MKAPREIVTCVCCAKQGPHAGRGLIRSCYMRHRKQGTLDQFSRERQPDYVDGHAYTIGECVCCGTEGRIKGRGLAVRCYERHRWAGTLDQFQPTGQAVRKASHAARREDYAFLRKTGESPETALQRVGLIPNRGNVWRYEVWLTRGEVA